MRLHELDYELPPELVAQHPAEPRDAARLLVYRRHPAGGDSAVSDRRFSDLARLLSCGDLLVRNDTRVLAARTSFRRPTGGRLEVLFLHPQIDIDAGTPCAAGSRRRAADEGRWEVLIRGRPRVGERLRLDNGGHWSLLVLQGYGDGRWLVQSEGSLTVPELLRQHGCMPLPPYIRAPLADPGRYQTTYARAPGSAAAPTAGLHFTPRLDAALARAGVEILEVTLHIGLGTFKPLEHDTVEQNRLHSEDYEVPLATWRRIEAAGACGRRVVAVGTTVVRLLEHLARGEPQPDERGILRGSTNLFITPGFRFRVIDALVTNFHLPRTSLLALVMAFGGVSQTRFLYTHAITSGYRFYSFGDAMMVL